MTNTSAEYRILYFPIRGLAEEFRLFLEEKEVTYTDETFEDPLKVWWTLKPTLQPLEQLPIVWHGDLKIRQSKAILRYMARKHGGEGKNEREILQADIVAESTNEWRQKFSFLCYNPDFESLKDQYIKETIPHYMKVLEYFLVENGNTGYFAGSDFTYADVCAFDMVDNNLLLDPNALSEELYPNLHQFYHAFKLRPRIAAYLKSERRRKFTNGAIGYFDAYTL
ncbi:glutathione S-transferase [Basidiobolus meristosporus CBS 931.73]|uniref:glutathione transferase n=1 Tax=Basidiobolus meristosporus CBS 931.73 TaxID=1314790 RepID=A0A1Y1YCJ3_9FUNG|nr:glutathione S-transferase [Basidiobolus meristosporus CBS 931.73]|eukprot:ORX95653.1 glutathione S-transferase [Basidiobolus meristosporus CBS 931.73]